MKTLFIFMIAVLLGGPTSAQKNHKVKHKNQSAANKNNDSYENGGSLKYKDDELGKESKNLPAKVRSAFNREYPYASNVSWTKNNGYWVASFPNGVYRTSVTYAANGERINGAS